MDTREFAMDVKYTENSICLCCQNDALNEVIDLGLQPLANSYLHSADEHEDKFPLKLLHCNNCNHLQLSHKVNPDLLFKNYLYVSGTSKTGMDYFRWFVDFSKGFMPNAKNVLDVACNDGSQLNQFADAGFLTYGIDPAENLYELSSKKNKIVCDYLTEESIKTFNTKFDLIIAQNVFAHVGDPFRFLTICKDYVSDEGYIFIQTSQANMIQNNEFDTIYHEHLSFFSETSMCAIARRCGLKVIDIKKPTIHGSSFIFILSKNGLDRYDDFYNSSIFFSEEKLKQYADNIDAISYDLNKVIKSYKDDGYKIIGYGAAAKGNTLLNKTQISLDYIVDDNPLKQGLFTPGMRISIKHPDVLSGETGKIIILPLAWNFFDEIKEKVLKRNKNVSFIKYFPKVEVYEI